MPPSSPHTILITGGAGFIGTHLADELLRTGYCVRILDNLDPATHGPGAGRPAGLHTDARLIVGDLRDADAVRSALEDVDAVCHLAAASGVGRSGHEIRHFTEVNNVGTAVLMEAILERHATRPLARLLVASTMGIYGEGLYAGPNGRLQTIRERPRTQLDEGHWEAYDDEGHLLHPVPTPELKRPALVSIDALTKYEQERMCLLLGRAHDIPTTVLRLFNVYGPGQPLANPHTGVIAAFATRYLDDQPPLLNEDGGQIRDFVHVADVVRAWRLALESPRAVNEVFNIGSGHPATLGEAAVLLGSILGKDHLEPVLTGQHRRGDIRHCYADITKAKERLGYQPQIRLEDGLRDFAESLRTAGTREELARARAAVV